MFKVHDYTIPKGHPNRGGAKIKPEAVVIHYTGNYSSTATDTANANYFKRAYKTINGVDYESDGKTKFRLGSAHKIVDCDSLAISIPDDECCWGCGDRPNNYNNGYKGQTRIAKERFGHNQNYKCVQYELAINKDWDAVVNNSIIIVAHDMNKYNIADKDIYRHYDITGKQCPAPMIGGAKEALWESYKRRVVLMRKYLKENPSYYDHFIKGQAACIVIKDDGKPSVPKPPTMVPPTHMYKVTGIKADSFLNVRNEPSTATSANIIGKLKANAQVPVFHAVDKNFLKCCGYVNKYYLSNGKVNTPGDTLNVRSNSNASASVLFSLEHNTKVEVVEELSNGWAKIKFFASSKYLTKI